MLNLALSVVALTSCLTPGTATARAAESVGMRLVGGSDPRAGRLESRHNGTWGTVCRTYFTDATARVVCRMLGHEGVGGRYVGHRYGRGSGPIRRYNVRCSGREAIADCPYRGSSGADDACYHFKDVSLSCIPDSTAAAALVGGGGNRRVGRLELFHGTQWGTVCDEGFTDAAAKVVCSSLGLGFVGRKADINLYGTGSGLIWLNNVNCTGTEYYIGVCSHGGWGVHRCSHRQDVAISCVDNSSEVNANDSTASATPVRLVGGGSSSTGRLEVLHDGVWGTVCENAFTAAAASVVCNTLGLGAGTKVDNGNYTTTGAGPIWLDDVRCSGTETDIGECSHRGWGVHDCQHRQDVAVSCGRTRVEVRLNGGRDPREGRVELFYNGTWGSVCRGGFSDAAARVVCNSLGFGYVGRPVRNVYGRGPGPFWLDSVQCGGTESDVAECPVDGWFLRNCSDGEEQAVSCLADNAVALFGGGSPREGRLEVYHNGSWGTVCNVGFTYPEARVVCHSLGFGHVGQSKSVVNYGSGTGRIWLNHIWCGGTERHIGECSHGGWGVHNCGHKDDAAVFCFDPGTRTYNYNSDYTASYVIFVATMFAVALPFILCIVLILISICRKRCRAARLDRNPTPPALPDIVPSPDVVTTSH